MTDPLWRTKLWHVNTLLPCFFIRLLEKVGEVQECCMTELELAEVDHLLI